MGMVMNSYRVNKIKRNQRGVSSLAITMLLLLIISLVVLFSTSVGFLEQRTASNEFRARMSEQAAEVAINMSGEYIKAKRALIISRNVDVIGSEDGWLATTGTGARWKPCLGVDDDDEIDGRPHPCRIEPSAARRNELWFYTTDGTGASIATTSLPFGTVGNVGGGTFSTTVNVQAVLCRIDSSKTPALCQNLPASGNRIAITFLATAELDGENTTAVIKETWASYAPYSPSSSVPLVASGIVKGLGNSQIVASPNAGGFGVAASMWSPNNIGFGTKNTNVCTDGSDNGAGGLGSSSTCHIEDYVFGTTVEPSNVKSTTVGCAASGAKCGCPNFSGRYLSGHVAGDNAEGLDILDVDGNNGALPDIAFYPGTSCTGVERDDPNVSTDDSLFEWIFNADVVNEGVKTSKSILPSVRQDCPGGDCAVHVLKNELGAQPITCAGLNAEGLNANGLYYVTDVAGCTITNQIGSPTQSVVVVVEQTVDLKDNFYGLLFVRSKNNTADVQVSGNVKLFGSFAVEGDINVTGTIDLVYDDVGVSADVNTLPGNVRFARVPGSWLDATEGF
jgi:hypothetical protein